MKSPFLIAVSLGAVALAAAFVPVLWRMLTGSAPSTAGPGQAVGTPWSIATTAPGGSRVFDLSLPGTTLGEVRGRWGDELQLAVIVGPRSEASSAPGGGEPGRLPADPPRSLEGYVEKFQSAGIAGRLLLTFDADPAALARWAETLPGEPTESGARRHALHGTPLDEASSAALVGVSFIPQAQLDEAVVSARFGTPAQRIRENARLEHWLYPGVGLAVALDAEGKEVLQYVAPADFEARLAAPLRAAPAAAAGSGAGPSPGAAR
jgi:hypothetical protein